ncbi:hypothetical protein QTP88_000839 [Uroleucon formosanum]
MTNDTYYTAFPTVNDCDRATTICQISGDARSRLLFGPDTGSFSCGAEYIENAFGILVSRFRIFEKPLSCEVSTADKIVRTCCALHNWLRSESVSLYMPRGSVDEENIDEGIITEGSWRTQSYSSFLPIANSRSNHSSQAARDLRDKYQEYFLNEGSVSWQEMMIY